MAHLEFYEDGNVRSKARMRRQELSKIGKDSINQKAVAAYTTSIHRTAPLTSEIMASDLGHEPLSMQHRSNSLTQGEKCVLGYPNGCG